MQAPPLCPVCDAAFAPGILPWHDRCPACGYERARLSVAIEGPAEADVIDEDVREEALKPLRLDSFALLLDAVERLSPLSGRSVLDVGSAHGWFLDAAQARGARTLGVEPEEKIIARAQGRHEMRKGYFPEALAPGERFDVIAFNDVFEHFPDPGACLDACRVRLPPGGLLVLNLPNRDGFYYRLARTLARLGARGPFERIWQIGFKSPHLSFFAPADLSRLAARRGFEEAARLELPSMRIKGLWARIRFDQTMPVWRAAAAWLAAVAIAPLAALFPSDAVALIFRPRP